MRLAQQYRLANLNTITNRFDSLRVAVSALVAERDAMKAALQGLVAQFPTDMDLDHIGWLASDVEAACAAYDAARALVEGKP